MEDRFNREQNSIRPALLGVAGAILGATAALLLSKRENRERLRRTFEEWAKDGKEMLGSVAERVSEYSEHAEDDLRDRLEEIRGTVDELSEELERKRSRKKRSGDK